MKKAGIIGGAGYVGGELIRLLLYHPQIELDYVHSISHSGQYLHAAHPDLTGETDQKFTDTINPAVDVIFLALGHGEAINFLLENAIPDNIHLIDMSQDFRVENNKFVYGLTELNHHKIRQATKIANPGCFATAILLGLLPAAENNMLADDIHVTAITGSTGAGQTHTRTNHFSWRYSNMSVYKAFQHQHMDEIYNSLEPISGSPNPVIYFLPFRGNFTRGILASSYFNCEKPLAQVFDMYSDYYQDSRFVTISRINPDLKQVVNTNKALIYLEKHEDTLLIISVIDNLIKGAAGQAVQNMNVMLGFDEAAGLNLKAAAF